MPEAQRIKTKVCLVGEAAVGKTSLIRRFVQDEFDDRYITTLGAKVSKREMAFETPDRTKIHMDMTVWDIMGEKGFRDLLKEAFFHGAKGVVAVCDLTRYSTLKELDDWVQSVFNVVGEIPVVYAVNKIDLKDEVMILYGVKEIQQAVRAFEAPYFYASAKTGENVEVLFRRLGTMVLQREGIAVATLINSENNARIVKYAASKSGRGSGRGCRMTKQKQLKSKVCLVGDKGVGKTSLISRYTINMYDEGYLTTLGTHVTKKEARILLPEYDLLVDIDITIWDIMGEKGFRELLKDAYFYGANGILAVADLTRRGTLDNLDDWIDGVEDVVGKVPILIAVNKSDLTANARFREIDVAAFAKAYHAEFFLTSAKTGERVEDAFGRLGTLVADEQLQLAEPV